MRARHRTPPPPLTLLRFLRNIPTNAETLAKVTSASSPSDWASLLSVDKYDRSIYAMQVIEAALNPADALYSYCGEELLEQTRAASATFARSFITTGGFAAVMELFCSTSKRVGGRGDAASLRIMRASLFGEKGEQGEQAEGLLGEHVSDQKVRRGGASKRRVSPPPLHPNSLIFARSCS